MRNFLSLLAGISYTSVLFSQSKHLPLNFKSYAIKLCVAKDESLALTTKAGEIGLAKSITADWLRTEPKENKDLFGLTLEQPNFFNKDTGFVSGFINKDGKYNIIYHTKNGGKSWKAIDFGQSGWVDDAVNLDNGEAWLSVAGSGIAYTSDYGYSWEKFEIPDVKQRFTNIFFNTSHEGIIGSLWNLLAYTKDNCKTWKWLPSPLDHKAYSKTNPTSRPAFDKVAIFNDLLLVKQESLVFYSKKDAIQWVWLKEYDDFYTDAANTALFLQTNQGNIIRTDRDLNVAYDFKKGVAGYDGKCKNGSLFIVTQDEMYKFDSYNNINSYSFATNESSNIEPVTIGYTNNGQIGVWKNKAYSQKEFNGNWQPIFTFPFDINDGKLSMDKYSLIIYDRNDDSLFYIDLSGKEVVRRSKTKMLTDFCKEGIKEISFEKGSQGCFHFYEDELNYTKRNNVFLSEGIKSSDPKRSVKLPDHSEEIDEEEINSFVKKIESLRDSSKQVTIEDLAFTKEEYNQCKKDILEFKESLQLPKKKKKDTRFSFYQNNIDFDRLLNVVDSVTILDPVRLNQMLTGPGDFWSTTSFWSGFKLVNYKNQIISVTSRYYSSNPFYFPWTVHLDGYTFATTNIEINKFLEKVYPSFVDDKDRMKVLYTLVKKLYLRKQ